MICFSYFCQKNCFSFRTWPIMTPFCANWAQKTIFKRFYQLFFGTTGLQHKLLILIEFPNITHRKSNKKGNWVWSAGQNLGQIWYNVVKKTKKICYFNVFFIFCMRYTFKAQHSVYRNT